MIAKFLKRLLSKKENGDIKYRIAEVENKDSERVRQRKAGIKGYIWRTVGDERVCERCRLLNGKKFRWDRKPTGGHPGECKTCSDGKCRCYAEPDWTTSPFNID